MGKYKNLMQPVIVVDQEGNPAGVPPQQREILSVISQNPNPTSTYNPPDGATLLILNANPGNTAPVKYGTSFWGRRLFLQPGDTIQLPAVQLSLESAEGVQEVGIMAFS